jgi:hypothetical protein
MPIIPFVGDDEGHLADTVRATRDYGGSFVLAGGLTMSGAQAEHTLRAAARHDASRVRQWLALYPGRSQAPLPPAHPGTTMPGWVLSFGSFAIERAWGIASLGISGRDRGPEIAGSPRSSF